MEKKDKLKKGDIFKDSDGNQIGFTQVGYKFIQNQSELKASSIKIYLYLIQQCGINNTLDIHRSIPDIRSGTGIKQDETITSAVRDLVINGWIKNITAKHDNSYIYRMNVEKQKPNMKLLEWLRERGKKNSENSKKLLAEGKVVRGESGRFQKQNLIEENKT